MGILILTGVFLSTERQYITAFQKSPDNRALFVTISWLAKGSAAHNDQFIIFQSHFH